MKLVQFFTDTDSHLGWSEVWYGIWADFTQARQDGLAICSARRQLLTETATLTYFRVTGGIADDTQARPRQQRQSILTKIDFDGQAPAKQKFGDWTTTAVKVRFEAPNPTIFRTQLMRGIPDEWWELGNDQTAKDRLGQLLGPYVAVLTARNVKIRHLNPIVPPALFRVYSYPAPVRATFTGYTRRATGRVFDLPRGRRSKRPA